MKYVIVGAGGTGGIIGFYMTKAGKDVTLIARGEHLQRMRTQGLGVDRQWTGIREIQAVKATDTQVYAETPDVILVCVKDYSLESVYPFIERVSRKETIIIPVLNVYTTGRRMQKRLSDCLVTDGCMYVSANIKEPGVLLQHAPICRVIFGLPDGQLPVRLQAVSRDLCDSGIDGVLSAHIQADAMLKFSYISPVGAAGLYCGCSAGGFTQPGHRQEILTALMQEIILLAQAMGVSFAEDPVRKNLDILASLPSQTTTSMQRDVLAGRPSEIVGLVVSVLQSAQEYGLSLPMYTQVTAGLRERFPQAFL